MCFRLFLNSCIVLITLGVAPKVWAEKFQFVTFQFPPLEYTQTDDTAHGLAVDIVTHVMQALGHKVKITVYPWPRALKMVRIGTADAIFTAYKNTRRQQFLDYSKQVLIPQEVYFYKIQDAKIDFKGNFHALKYQRIGVVSTISYGPRFDHAKTELMIDKARTLEHNFMKLLLGRVDLVPSNRLVAEYTLDKLNLNGKIVRLAHRIESIPSYIAFSKIRCLTKLRDQFDHQLTIMKKKGTYANIINMYNARFTESK